MIEKKNENAATLVQTSNHELTNDDSSIFVSEAINNFVLRSALFSELESRIRGAGIRHSSPVIEAS